MAASSQALDPDIRFHSRGISFGSSAKERAIRALHSDDSPQAGTLWTTLVELSIRIASAAGESTVAALTAELRKLSFRLAGQRRFATARATIAESSRNALDDIGDQVGDVTLGRIDRLAEVRAALDRGRVPRTPGDAGVGKSGLLKHIADQIATRGRRRLFRVQIGRRPADGAPCAQNLVSMVEESCSPILPAMAALLSSSTTLINSR